MNSTCQDLVTWTNSTWSPGRTPWTWTNSLDLDDPPGTDPPGRTPWVTWYRSLGTDPPGPIHLDELHLGDLDRSTRTWSPGPGTDPPGRTPPGHLDLVTWTWSPGPGADPLDLAPGAGGPWVSGQFPGSGLRAARRPQEGPQRRASGSKGHVSRK